MKSLLETLSNFLGLRKVQQLHNKENHFGELKVELNNSCIFFYFFYFFLLLLYLQLAFDESKFQFPPSFRCCAEQKIKKGGDNIRKRTNFRGNHSVFSRSFYNSIRMLYYDLNPNTLSDLQSRLHISVNTAIILWENEFYSPNAHPSTSLLGCCASRTLLISIFLFPIFHPTP